MARDGTIEASSPRAIFADLLAGALGEARPEPSPMAVAYLLELLDTRVRVSERSERDALPGTLAEELLAARVARGALRIRRMRNLGDEALFTAGFFGDSLARKVVDIGYYCDVGRTAYLDLARVLGGELVERSWPGLFWELAERFSEFVSVLAEVSDRTCRREEASLLRLYERYLETGSERDRRRLVRRGQLPPARGARKRWQ